MDQIGFEPMVTPISGESLTAWPLIYYEILPNINPTIYAIKKTIEYETKIAVIAF